MRSLPSIVPADRLDRDIYLVLEDLRFSCRPTYRFERAFGFHGRWLPSHRSRSVTDWEMSAIFSKWFKVNLRAWTTRTHRLGSFRLSGEATLV